MPFASATASASSSNGMTASTGARQAGDDALAAVARCIGENVRLPLGTSLAPGVNSESNADGAIRKTGLDDSGYADIASG